MSMTEQSGPIRLGVVGLGRAFTLMQPSFSADPRFTLAAGADPRPAARAAFAADFAARTYESGTDLAADPDIEAIYIATPHQAHAQDAIAALAGGKHVLVEKPMALTLAECQAMADAATRAGRHLIVGHSHAFDAPIARAYELIDSGKFGRLRMIHALYTTDFLYRPRRPEELDTAQGGGVMFNQAPHQVDIVRLLGGGMVSGVRALVGAWDPARPTEGAYTAQLRFADGAFASLTYSGYAHFDADTLCGDISESGRIKTQANYGAARRALRATSPAAEAALRAGRGFGAAGAAPGAPPDTHEHFGFILASCDHADLRPLPDAVMIHGDAAITRETLARPALARQEVLDALAAAVRDGLAPRHDAAWGLATMEVCLAMRESAACGNEITLRHQVPVRR